MNLKFTIPQKNKAGPIGLKKTLSLLFSTKISENENLSAPFPTRNFLFKKRRTVPQNPKGGSFGLKNALSYTKKSIKGKRGTLSEN